MYCVLTFKKTQVNVLWEPGLAKVNSGHTNWKRAVSSRGCGEYNLGVYYKLSGEGVGDHKDNSNSFTGLAVGVRGSVGLFLVQERETAINPLHLSLTPETGLQSVCFPLLRCSRPSAFRILWLRLKRLLIAWLIHSTLPPAASRVTLPAASRVTLPPAVSRVTLPPAASRVTLPPALHVASCHVQRH